METIDTATPEAKLVVRIALKHLAMAMNEVREASANGEIDREQGTAVCNESALVFLALHNRFVGAEWMTQMERFLQVDDLMIKMAKSVRADGDTPESQISVFMQAIQKSACAPDEVNAVADAMLALGTELRQEQPDEGLLKTVQRLKEHTEEYARRSANVR